MYKLVMNMNLVYWQVVNIKTNEVQSVWYTRGEALETMMRLNKYAGK